METKIPSESTEDQNNPVQDEFDEIIQKNFSPGDEIMMEERAKAGLEHRDTVGRGYTGEGGDRLDFRARLKARRKLLLGLGAGGAITLLIVGGLFGFLNLFKLDHIMSNIDARTFARLNGVADRRSVRWMQAYMQMRLADIGDKPNLDKGTRSDNQFFRSEKVSTGSPIRDWYRTLRTSKFEQEVFEKHGFKFVSVRNADGTIRPGKIILNGNTLQTLDISQADWDGLEKGDTAAIRKYSDLVDLEKFDTDKDARRAIRQAVNDETRFFQVYNRRHIRKAIQNMTGVRDWRFFENTRTKIDEKKIQIRNRILTKAIPANLKSGQILRCLFGIDDCRYSRDTKDPVNQSAGRDGNKVSTRVDSVDSPVDENGKPIVDKDNKPSTTKLPVKTDEISEEAADLAAKIGTKLGSSLNALTAAVNITGTLEMLSNIDRSIPRLGKMAVIAKGVQAMGLYQVFKTARDQIKSGDVNGAEVNQFMQVIGPVASSEGYSKVISGEGNAGQLTDTKASQDYCSNKSQAELEKDPGLGGSDKFSFAYLCTNKQIGGSSNAQNIQDKYDGTIGKVVHPIAGAYGSIKKIPIIGSIISGVNQTLSVLGDPVSTLVMGLLDGLGLGDNLKSVLTYVMGKLASFLGAGPIMTGDEWAGEYMNWLVQGGAFTAESTARAEGASLTTPESKAAALASLRTYQRDEQAQMTAFDRLLSTSNPDSLASKSLFGITQLQFSSVGNLFANLGQALKSASLALFSSFNHKAAAAGIDGYAGANFAGIETYDFPPQCYNLDPITAQPLDGTNALDVFANPAKYGLKNGPITVSLGNQAKLESWDTQTNSEEFYETIYQIITGAGHKDDADDIALQIYNCNLLDTAVRGSLGSLYGYTNDNGLEETYISSNTDVAPTSAATTLIDAAQLYNDSTPMACYPPTTNLGIQDGYHDGKVIKIRICALPNLPSSGAESRGEYGVKNANGQTIVNSRVSGAFYELIEAARKNGQLAKGASSTFRTMAHQTTLCNQNSACRNGNYKYVAKPGTSNHQMGLAIDFYINELGISSDQCINISGRCTAKDHSDWDWLEVNAAGFGINQYVNEFWHWSPTGN